jgi:DNA segregation ATPase FtsK/SpoIIIE-like protein
MTMRVEIEDQTGRHVHVCSQVNVNVNTDTNTLTIFEDQYQTCLIKMSILEFLDIFLESEYALKEFIRKNADRRLDAITNVSTAVRYSEEVERALTHGLGPLVESSEAAFHLLKNNAVKLVRKSGEMLIDGVSETLMKVPAAPQLPKPQPEDPFYPEALRISKVAGQTSNLLLQRRLGLGPVHAGRLIDRMEKEGYCGPTNNRSPREWLGKEIPAAKQASDQDSPLNNQRAASPERLQQEDEWLYPKALQVSQGAGKISTNILCKSLQIGPYRAGRLLERMEQEGRLGRADRLGRREVIVKDPSSPKRSLIV